MKSLITVALCGLLATSAIAQTTETLTNDTILTLSSAGLGDDAIVAKIKSSPKPSFDTSTAALLALRQKGVSGPIIAAMIAAANPAVETTLSVDSPDPMVPHPAGVYLLTSEPTAKMIRMDATVSNQAKTGGVFGAALTGGLSSISIKAVIQGDMARVSAHNSMPTFYFFFDASNSSAGQAGTWQSGDRAVVTSPAEFSLVELRQKDRRREARVGSANVAGTKTGVMDKDRIEFTYDPVRLGVYRVTPKAPLKPGEYGFLYGIGGAGGALTARIYDFGVR